MAEQSTSPKRIKKHLRKKSDLFFQLDGRRESDPLNQREEEHESLLSRYSQSRSSARQVWTRLTDNDQAVLTPVLFLSFLFSLLYIDNRNRLWRVNSHPTHEHPSLWFRLSPWRWGSAQPYQEPTTTTWQKSHSHSTSGGAPGPQGAGNTPDGSHFKASGRSGNNDGWFYRVWTRKIAKMEISDALEMRGRVLAALMIGTVAALTLSVWSLKLMVNWALS